MAYTNRQLIENYLQRSLSENEIAALPVIIPAAEQWIDSTLNSTFDVATPTTRNYEADGKSLDIDPCTAITALTSNDPYNIAYYTYQTFEYVAEPINETVKREIRLRYGNFPEGTSNISVTATFSEYDGGVPEDIVIAATRIVGGIINAGKAAGNNENLTHESLEGHMVRYNTTNLAIATLAETDPILKAVFDGRKEVMIW